VYNNRDAMDCPEQAREPAPNEKCWIPLASDSVGGDKEDSHRSGSNVAAEGPKWDTSVNVSQAQTDRSTQTTHHDFQLGH
jgi:hypothetical protein